VVQLLIKVIRRSFLCISLTYLTIFVKVEFCTRDLLYNKGLVN